ncbi:MULTISPECIES: ABC transporter permease [Actinomyces]|uniref:Autoinducer 2 import system permease protein LsrD n=1 Tax=Actinomyces glycerinitolerans TaxID=1892869 RepID=A0A1M4RWP9_9ACTO|nr:MULTISPECIES: ABC transporter permease [Actinomyces]RAX20468.1 ABC transporter permease [Actinomyces sp. Z3]SHE24369.1 abc transporter permease [Actinomyces glycerinitolerans]
MKAILIRYRWETVLVILILLGVVIGSMLSPYFLDFGNFSRSAMTFVPVALMTLGLFPVVVTGEIDISLPSTLAVSAVLFAKLSEGGVEMPAALVASALLCTFLGAVNGVLVAVAGLPSMAVTLGAMGVYRGIAYLIGGDAGVTGISESYLAFGRGWVWWFPVPVVVFIVMAVLVWLLMSRSNFGSYAYAIGSGAPAVRSAGISVARTKIGAYVFASLMAWLAGLVWVGEYMSARGDNGDGTIMLVLTGVVLGGVSIFGGSGKTSGVVLSCCLLLVLQTAMSLANVPGTTQTLISGAVLLIAVIVPNAGQLIDHLHRRSPGRSVEHAQ